MNSKRPGSRRQTVNLIGKTRHSQAAIHFLKMSGRFLSLDDSERHSPSGTVSIPTSNSAHQVAFTPHLRFLLFMHVTALGFIRFKPLDCSRFLDLHFFGIRRLIFQALCHVFQVIHLNRPGIFKVRAKGRKLFHAL